MGDVKAVVAVSEGRAGNVSPEQAGLEPHSRVTGTTWDLFLLSASAATNEAKMEFIWDEAC